MTWDTSKAVLLALVVGLIGFGIGTQVGGDGGGDAAAPAPVSPSTVESASPSSTEIESPSLEPSVSPEPEVSTLAYGDLKACELVDLAVTREANSPSWVDILSSAESKAKDYDLQDAIDKAYWTSANAKAKQRTEVALQICMGLGYIS